MYQLCKIAFAGMALLASSACAGIKDFRANFEKQWSNPELFDETLDDKAGAQAKMDAQSLALVEAGVIENNDCSTARTNAKRAITLLPDSEWPRVVIAECNLAAGDARTALASFEKMTVLASEPRVLIGTGIAHIHLGDYESAMPPIEEALEINAELWRGWNALGVAFDMDGRREDAAEAFLTAAELNTASGAPLNNLGMSFMQLDELEMAITAFHTALEREPDLVPARLNLRIAYAMNGEYAKAVAGASDDERATVYNNAGVAAMRRGEHDRARSLFKKALDTSPVYYAIAHHNLERLPR